MWGRRKEGGKARCGPVRDAMQSACQAFLGGKIIKKINQGNECQLILQMEFVKEESLFLPRIYSWHWKKGRDSIG